jgi:hypothetical protein
MTSNPYSLLCITMGGTGHNTNGILTDGTKPLRSGDTVAWYHPAANQVYDCAGSRCSLQVRKAPSWHLVAPYSLHRAY